MALTNDGKWFNYVDQTRLYADTTSPNLDTDLQANIANELEISYWESFAGRVSVSSLAPASAFKGAVVGNSGTLTSTSAGNVTVDAVTGYVEGRRATTSSSTSLTLLASKTYFIYLKITDIDNYSITSKSWPGEIVALESSVSAPAYSMVLATVVTNGSNAVTITDQRFLYQPSQIASYQVDSNPQSSGSNYPQTYAYSLSDRLDMIVTRIANIIGDSNWLNNITDTVTLATLNSKFSNSATTGHSHNGTSGQGVKIDSAYVEYTYTFDQTAQTDVSGALTSLYVNKLSLGGSDSSKRTMTAPLTLSGNPTLALHAATKDYVDGKLSRSMQTGYLHRGKPVGFFSATGVPPALSGWTTVSATAPTTGQIGENGNEASNDGQSDGGISVTTNINGQLVRFITPEPMTLRVAFNEAQNKGGVSGLTSDWWNWFIGLRVYFRVTRNGTDIYTTGNPSWATSIDVNRMGWSADSIKTDSGGSYIGTGYQAASGDTLVNATYLLDLKQGMYSEKIPIPDFYDAPASSGTYTYKLEAAICTQDRINGTYGQSSDGYPITDWESQCVVSFDNVQCVEALNQGRWGRGNLQGFGQGHMVAGAWLAIVGG